MRDPFQWSIGVGQWGGTAVRLHVLFLAFAAATFYFAWPKALSFQSFGQWWDAGGNLLGPATAAIALVFASVLLHELSHAFVARQAGANPATITLGPLGGLTAWRLPSSPRIELAVFLAGPLANLALALVLAVTVLALHPEHDARSLLNPLQPPLPADLTQGLTVGLWVNWLLFLVNLLPAHPFDGERILRAVIRLVRPTWSARRVAESVCGVAVAASAVLAVTGLVLAKHNSTSPYPVWAVLLLLAVMLLVSARRELLNVQACLPVVVPPDTANKPQGAALERTARRPVRFQEPPVASLPWEVEPNASEDPAEREEIEAEEERQVDGILSRLHAHGIDSLTVDERRLLDRVSARYRSRLGKRS